MTKLSRRLFLIGTATSAVAAITPLGVLTSEIKAAEISIDPQALEFLRRVSEKWNSLAEYYDFETVYNYLLPNISGSVNNFYGHLEDNPQQGMTQCVSAFVEDEFFDRSSKNSITARYKINEKWYTLTLENDNVDFKSVPIKKLDDSFVQKCAEHITRDAKKQIENSNIIFWDK